MAHSVETRHLLNNHIQITQLEIKNLDKAGADRHEVLEGAVGELKSALKWAGGLVVSLILTVLGWAVMQQLNANESQKKEMAQQIEILQSQERARVQTRSEILSRLPSARTAESARATDSAAQALDDAEAGGTVDRR